MKESFFTYQGKKLYYRDAGAGRTIVLLHGFPFDGRIWLPFAKKLLPSFRLIIPNLPGFGKSELPAGPLDMNVMAWAVAGLINHLKIGRHIVVGHSMGGYVALSMASASMTGGLAGLVLFHSQAAADDEPARLKRNESIQLILQDKQAFIDSFLPGLYGNDKPAEAFNHAIVASSQSPETMAAAMAGLRDRANRLDWLNKADIPVLFIIGKNDTRMQAGRIMEQAALLAQAEVLLLQGVGHMGFDEAGDVIYPVLRDFCNRNL